ncbi:response regulator transcription factor [Shewanella sp. GXUN23E]|uniref:response regulator transcription factor n=1 Tax=Shewanella sp. GXUN23E TaxID=3422498 RepID=UPI003D7D09AA
MKRILIVEDDHALASVLCRRLGKHGFDCTHVDNPSDALLQARRILPSHILLDMKLELSNGLSLISPLRQLLPRVTMVLLTGYASIATAVEAIRAGADNYLAKPVDTQTLLAALLPAGQTVAEAEVFDEVAPMNPRRLEWEHLQQVLQANQGNVSATARQLGMHRRTLQRKLLKKPVLE